MITRRTSCRSFPNKLTTLLMAGLPWLLAAIAPVCAQTSLPFALWQPPLNRHLHQDSILHVLQDSEKSLWIVTLEGITRFQGKHATHYRDPLPDSRKSDRLRVTGMVEAWQGRILVATLGGGLLVFDASSDRFRRWAWGDGHRAGDLQIAELARDSDDQLWLGLENGQVIRLRGNGHYQRIGAPVQAGRISTLRPLPNGGVVAGTLNGLLRWLSRDGELLRQMDARAACKLKRIEEALSLPDDSLLLGTRGAGLWHLDPQGNCRRVPGFETGVLAQSSVHALHVLEAGNSQTGSTTLVGTDHGLLAIDSQGTLQHLQRSNSALQDDEVISMATASDGLAWVGTYDGLFLLDRLAFEHASDGQHPGLKTIAGLSSLPNGDLVVGAYQGLLVRRGAEHLAPNAAGLPGGLHNRGIMGVYRHGNSLFIAYREAGLEWVDLSSGTTRKINSASTPALPSDAVSAVLLTHSNDLLVGTYGGGLGIIAPDGDIRVYRAGSGADDLADDRVLFLHQSSEGKIWVGTESGLQHFRPRHGQFARVRAAGVTDEGSAPVIWAATETTGGDIWLGSLHQGLWQLRAGKLHPDPTPDTRAQTIYALESDAEGQIWYTSNRGLNLRTSSGKHRRLSAGFGLPNMEFELNSSHRDRHGFIYFGGNQGYFRFHPKQVELQGPETVVALTRYRLADNLPRPLHGDRGTATIELGREDYWIGLEYSALSYRHTEEMRYRYRLRGLDPGWIDAGTSRQAVYTNLPPGSYQFDVQATRGSDFSYAPASSVTLKVPPPAWQSGWALAGYGLTLLALLALARHQLRLQADRRHARMQARESEAAAARMADSLQDRHQLHLQLLGHLHRQQTALLEWALPVDLTGLPTDRLAALHRFLKRIDRHSLGSQEQIYIDLRALVETLSETSDRHPCPALIVNQCDRLRLPWQAAMEIGLALWCILEGWPACTPDEETCLLIENEAVTPDQPEGSCKIRILGDFDPLGRTAANRELPPPWRIARQALIARGGGTTFDPGLITLWSGHGPGREGRESAQ